MLQGLKKKLKKNRKKGFTLVEVIVVLVILAILAAIAIPSLTGYIDKAKEKAVISQTRSAVVAAQTIVSEEYAKGTTNPVGAVTPAVIKQLTGDQTIADVQYVKVNGSSISQLRVESGGKYGYFFNGTYDSTTPGSFVTTP
jgi:type IV pilus assembly protein PilA